MFLQQAREFLFSHDLMGDKFPVKENREEGKSRREVLGMFKDFDFLNIPRDPDFFRCLKHNKSKIFGESALVGVQDF